MTPTENKIQRALGGVATVEPVPLRDIARIASCSNMAVRNFLKRYPDLVEVSRNGNGEKAAIMVKLRATDDAPAAAVVADPELLTAAEAAEMPKEIVIDAPEVTEFLRWLDRVGHEIGTLRELVELREADLSHVRGELDQAREDLAIAQEQNTALRIRLQEIKDLIS